MSNITLILSLIAILILAPVGVTQAAPDPVITKGLVFVNLWTTDDGLETQLRYELRSGGAPAISNVVLEVCTSRLLAVTVESMAGTQILPWSNNQLKIETEQMGDNEVKIITLHYTGAPYSAKSTTATWKAGQQTGTSDIYGVLCTPNAIAGMSFAAQPLTLLATVRHYVAWLGVMIAPK
jgi:hypothetical protein